MIFLQGSISVSGLVVETGAQRVKRVEGFERAQA
jgi:hypothetical protein